MIIGLDIDGVLRDLSARFFEVYAHKTGKIPPFTESKDIPTYYFHGYFDEGEEIYKMWFERWAEEIYLSAYPLGNVSALVDKCRKLGHRVYVVSNQPNLKCEQMTWKWLIDNEIYPNAIIFNYKKNTTGIDILVDDAPHFLEMCAYSGIKTVAVDYPYNRHIKTDYRVSSLYEFVELLEKGGITI